MHQRQKDNYIMHSSYEMIINVHLPSRDQVQGVTERSLEGNQGQRRAPRARCQGRCLFPFLPPPLSCRGSGSGRKPRGWGDGLAICAHNPDPHPAPGHRGPEGSSTFFLSSLSTPSSPLVEIRPGWFHGEWAHVERSPQPLPYPNDVGAEAVRGAGQLPRRRFSLPLRNCLGCRCDAADPAGAGGAGPVDTPPRRVLAARREEATAGSQSHGWCCAEPAPPSALRPGTLPARLRAPAPAQAASRG